MILKRNMVTTFTSCFLINVGALIALLSLLDINLIDLKATWLIITVSAMLTLFYVLFFLMTYGEKKHKLHQDIDRILNNEMPE